MIENVGQGCSYCIENDMKDEDLAFYTANGKEAGGFFVATINEKIVGTVAYIFRSEKTIEVFRVSIDKRIRKAGIAAKLMIKIEDVAKEMGVKVIVAETSSAQVGALNFYPRIGYQKVSELEYSGFIFHNIKLIKFAKGVK